MRRDILAAQGTLLDAAQVADHLGWDMKSVHSHQREGLLLALPTDTGELGFPSWQFSEFGLMPGLNDVLRAFGVRDPWMRAAFFLTGNLRLDSRTPLEVLLRGEVEAVRTAAAAYGEHGAA